MNDLMKITQVVDRYMSLIQYPKLDDRTQGLVSIEIAIALGEYQAEHGNLDLDAMLTTDAMSCLAHDISGIWNKDNFTPRFIKH